MHRHFWKRKTTKKTKHLKNSEDKNSQMWKLQRKIVETCYYMATNGQRCPESLDTETYLYRPDGKSLKIACIQNFRQSTSTLNQVVSGQTGISRYKWQAINLIIENEACNLFTS